MYNSNKKNALKDLRSEFFNYILNWNPNWFRNKNDRNKIPNVIENIKMTSGQLHYNDVKEYQNVMFPQLIHEYWFTLKKDYEAFFKDKRYKKIEINDCSIVSPLNELVCHHFGNIGCCVNGRKIECIHPRKGDLVELFVKGNKYFAYVVDKNVSRKALCYVLLLGNSSRKNLFNYKLSSATITSITFLEGSLGMVDALKYLETFPLCKLILSPDVEQYRIPSQLKLNLSDIPTKACPNSSQLRVISGIIEAIELLKPKICLVQGPPGTGKSNTIINLIASMIKRNSNIQFLVCAASNKAVDSLALRLMKIQPILKNESIPFKIVRIGNKEKINRDVQNIYIERLAEERRQQSSEQSLTRLDEKEHILEESQVITSTLTSCYTNSCMRQVFRENPFHRELVCIVDEAAQANELEILVPLLLGVKYLFLVGDHQQLEPIVLSQNAKRYGFNSSLFFRAQKIFKHERINPIAILDTQYRMAKPISFWPNKYFYNGRLKDAATSNSLGICNYMLFNHHFQQNARGHANIKEAKLVVKFIIFLRKKLNLKESSKITIGIITPYHEQRELIENLLNLEESKFQMKLPKPNNNIPNSWNIPPRNHGIFIEETIETSMKFLKNLKLDENSCDEKVKETIPISVELLKNLQLDFGRNCYKNDDDDDNNNNNDIRIYKKIEISQELINNLRLDFGFKIEDNKTIEVNTVDSFQGSERDIIIMSCVRSHQLGFTNNPNRLNVSITRAKHTLIMFGNFKAFTKNKMWSNMIQDATVRNVVVEVNDTNAELMFKKHVIQKLP